MVTKLLLNWQAVRNSISILSLEGRCRKREVGRKGGGGSECVAWETERFFPSLSFSPRRLSLEDCPLDDDGSEIGREAIDGKMQIHFRVWTYNGLVKLFTVGSAMERTMFPTDWIQKII